MAGQEGDALGSFYAGDEAIRRANRQTGMGRMGTAASVSQAVRDRNAQQKLNYRLMLEQALGGSIRSNKDYINNMIGGLGSDLITAGAYLDGGYDFLNNTSEFNTSSFDLPKIQRRSLNQFLIDSENE